MSKQAKIRIINAALSAIADAALTNGTSDATEQALAYWQAALNRVVGE